MKLKGRKYLGLYGRHKFEKVVDILVKIHQSKLQNYIPLFLSKKKKIQSPNEI